MTAAREYDSVRTTADIVCDDGRTIPAGMKGAVLQARPDGSCLAEFAFAPQTAGTHGDFVQAALIRDQYEVMWKVTARRSRRCSRSRGRCRMSRFPGGISPCDGSPGGFAVGSVPRQSVRYTEVKPWHYTTPRGRFPVRQG